ncbi:MAG: glucose-6-phosphate isomerase [Bacteroidota bacterium]
MAVIDININRIFNFVDNEAFQSIQDEVNFAYNQLTQKTGEGNEFLGWLSLASETIHAQLIEKLNHEAKRIQKQSQIVVVVGIGGSYLGARAIIEALSSSFHCYRTDDIPEIIYAGQNISEDYLTDLLELLNRKDYSIIVISKSGTTTEPALAFRLLKNHIEKKYGKVAAKNRITAITDQAKGALKKLAVAEGYSCFVIPDDVGGRYSVLTPVGLLPIAVSGFDIEKLLQGASRMEKELQASSSITENPACQYAAARNLLYRAGKPVEIFVNYQPNLHYFSEWWKQLFGESEGKDKKGIFTASVGFTTDLHSLGQYIQDGLRVIFETMLLIDSPKHTLKVPFEEGDADGLNFLTDKRISDVNKMAALGTTVAHADGGVPVLTITLPELNEYNLGQLMYFFEFACGVSGYLMEVNPFNQPGVEAYKNNMFALLGKHGYEVLQKEILGKIIS